mgnify:FL=1
MPASSEEIKKYPFLKGAQELISGLSLKNLSDFPGVLELAEKKILFMLGLSSEKEIPMDKRSAVAAFSASLAIITATGNRRLIRSYASALSRDLEKELSMEVPETYIKVAQSIGISSEFDGREFRMPLPSYLSLKGIDNDPELLLPQLKLERGIVYFQVNIFRKLIAAVFRKILVEKMESEMKELSTATLDPKVREFIAYISAEFSKRRGEEIDISSLSPIESLYPPCVKFWISEMNRGINIPHQARFLVATFLLSLDMSVDEVLKYFSRTPDFDERIARYQVEDLAGQRGSGKKYSVPRCETLRTTGVCTCKQGLCQRMTHPLLYYKISVKKKLNGDPSAGRECSSSFS